MGFFSELESANNLKEFFKIKTVSKKTEQDIYKAFFEGKILVCRNCGGLFDYYPKRPKIECPHCYHFEDVFGKIAGMDCNNLNEDEIVGFENEGQYIGRITRNENIVLD